MMLSQIPITGDLLTAGVIAVTAAVWIMNRINETRSELRKEAMDLAERLEDAIAAESERIDKIERELALLDQRSLIEDQAVRTELSRAIDCLTILKGRVAQIEIEQRDFLNWIQSRGANFRQRTGGYPGEK